LLKNLRLPGRASFRFAKNRETVLTLVAVLDDDPGAFRSP
jgi:hypothetical protein